MYTVGQEVFVDKKEQKFLLKISAINQEAQAVTGRFIFGHESLPGYTYPFERLVVPTAEELKLAKAPKFRFRAHKDMQKRTISEIRRAIPDKFEVFSEQPSPQGEHYVIITIAATEVEKWSGKAWHVMKNYSAIKLLSI